MYSPPLFSSEGFDRPPEHSLGRVQSHRLVLFSPFCLILSRKAFPATPPGNRNAISWLSFGSYETVRGAPGCALLAWRHSVNPNSRPKCSTPLRELRSVVWLGISSTSLASPGVPRVLVSPDSRAFRSCERVPDSILQLVPPIRAELPVLIDQPTRS